MMALDVDGVPWRDLATCDKAPPQRGLAIQAVLHGDVLEEAGLGGWRGEKGEASEEAAVGAADRIDGAHASGGTAHRFEDTAQGEARIREAFLLDRPSRRDEGRSASLEEGGNEAKATSAGRGQPALEQGGDVMLDVVAGHDAWARLAGAVEDFDLLFGQEAGREGHGGQPFFLERP